MDPAEALTDLKQISTQVERAVVVRNDGALEASTLRDAAAAQRIARGGTHSLRAPAGAGPGARRDPAGGNRPRPRRGGGPPPPRPPAAGAARGGDAGGQRVRG